MAGMDIAPDGSPVALYRRLPERVGDAALVHRLLPEDGSALDLGCGTGRLAEPLARLGHPVTGVDNEPRMLAHLRSATPVCAGIAGLDLGGERFDAVLLMSHLVNAADEAFVMAALRAARRHVRDGGPVIAERYPPGWVLSCAESSRESDGVRYTLTGVQRRDGVLTATMRYEFDGLAADQRFSAREVGDKRLGELAASAGLRLGSALNTAGTLMPLRA
jgi:SAM-dependent methyltransferase